MCNLKHTESWNTRQTPQVLENNPHNQEIGQHWLKQAEAEHASVASFARHTLQLMSIGAPSEILVASQRASLDEIEHAKVSYGFASTFIGRNFRPGPLDVRGGLEGMDLKEIIRSLILEGCIEETFSAIDAHLAAYNAMDDVVRVALSQIASDETKHAQLAWDTIQWISDRYPETRTFVEEVFSSELDACLVLDRKGEVLTATCEDLEKENSFRRYGILNQEDREKVRDVGLRNIITPVFRDGFKDVSLISKRIFELDMARF